jgi:hypothetical protein
MAGHIIPRRRISARQPEMSRQLPNHQDNQPDALAVVHEVLLHMDIAPDLVRRAPQAATTSSALPAKSCAPNDSSPACEKPSGSTNTTLPIVLGVVIPLTVAMVIFIVLHRRHVRKLRSEDANDRHKSLDFGMGEVRSSGKKGGKQNKKGKSVPEMSIADTEKTLGRGRGMSMDLDMSNPYLLPPELQQSRESLHSMSRTVNNGDDKYRPATNFIPNDGSAPREGSTSRGADDSSSYTASSRRVFGERDYELNQSLLRHAQRMSRSMPPTRRTSVTSASSTPAFQDPEKSYQLPRKLASPVPANEGLAPILSEQNRDSYRSDVSKDGPAAGLRKSHDYLGAFIRSGGPTAVESNVHEPPPRNTPSPPQIESTDKARNLNIAPAPKLLVEPEPLTFDFPKFDGSVPTITMDAPGLKKEARETPQLTERKEARAEQYEQDFDYDVRRLTMGIRPLPPDDPTDNPEQRAIRIRSFYKEYFDDAKPGPVYTQEDYHDGSEGFAYDGPIYEEPYSRPPNMGAPFAQPIARRAMTPPPRGSSSLQAPGRMVASASGGRFVQAGPRAYSSASGRIRAPNQGPLKKKAPPPAPLLVLPTPHLLKDDMMIPIDFAPPSSYKERRAGTPDSLKGGLRPYSPALPAHLPLASSFDDLAMMPSP